LRKRCLPKGLFCQQYLPKIWLSVGPFFRSFGHNSLVSCPFLARKVSNRSSHHVLQNGQGAVSSIQLSVWSMVRSNLGQTWSTLVKLGQTWEMCPRPRFEVIWCDEPSSDQADLVRAASFCVSTPEKIPGVKMGL
jgi:hypothetical protein